jgi:hypothetical protein
MTPDDPKLITQDDKRRVLASDRLAREQGSATYKDFASAFANENRGGRFAKSDTGPTVKALPAASPWSGAQAGPGTEEPLGYDINAVPDLGFPLNKQSVAQAPSVSPSDVIETATERSGPHQPAPSSFEDVSAILGSGAPPAERDEASSTPPLLRRIEDDPTDQ